MFGWSSATFNPDSVHEPVTSTLFDYQSGLDHVQRLHLSANLQPHLDWKAAQILGERLMATEAERRGFRIESLREARSAAAA